MLKQNLLDFKSIMGTTLNIVRWYNPRHPKCRNCGRWVSRDCAPSHGDCSLRGWHREHTHPACGRFKRIIGEYLT